jgi:outer membrane protein TolC
VIVVSTMCLLAAGAAWTPLPVRAGVAQTVLTPLAPAAPVLTLRAAIALALEHSPEMRPAEDGVVLAGIQEELAESRFGLKITPTFRSGGFGYGLEQQALGLSVSRMLPTGTELSLFGDASRWNGGASEFRDGGYAFTLSQPLLRGFGPVARSDVDAARRGTERSTRRLGEARQQLIVNVADAYFAIVQHGRLLAASDLALDRATRLRVASEARASVGLATQLDVLRADLLASRSEAERELQREALETSRDRLNLIVGRLPGALLEVSESDIGADPFNAERLAGRPIDDLVSMAIATRPEVAESRAGIGDARRSQSVARWNMLPDVRLNASYAQRGFGSLDTAALNRLLGGWRLGVSTSYPLDQSATAAAAATADVGLLAAERNVIETERRVAADVRRAHRGWTRAAGTIAIQRKALDIAERQLRLAELRYERGIADNFDVVDAEHQVLQAQAALIAAEIGRELAGLQLLRAMGTLDARSDAR